MPKPVLLTPVPPVTIGGRNPPVVANLFDDSGMFRQRNGSFKRQRVEGGAAAAGEGFYDLSREASAPSLPNVPRLDVGKIRGLMVKANELATAIRSRYTAESVPEGVRELAGFFFLYNVFRLPTTSPPPLRELARPAEWGFVYMVVTGQQNKEYFIVIRCYDS
jgi:hypothetical protein